MSLMSPVKQQQDVVDDDDDATANDALSLSEDFGHYDSHEENDDTFLELDFSQHSINHRQLPNRTVSTKVTHSPNNTSTPLEHQVVLPEEQEYPLPTYDEVMHMDSLNTPTTSNVTHHYPDESQIIYRHKT